MGACSPRNFALHEGCPCSYIWDPIPFLGLAFAGENVPLYSPFEFACNVLLATSLYRKLVLLFLIYTFLTFDQKKRKKKEQTAALSKKELSVS